MALQSEVSPPLVGDPNKDTQIEGDTKSDDDSSRCSEDEVDLEEGEILDSGGEESDEKKDLTNSSLQEALDKNFLKNIEKLISQEKDAIPLPIPNKNTSPHSSPHKIKKRYQYHDHDHIDSNSDDDDDDNDDGWYHPRKSKSTFEKPLDYRKELEAYRGTPPSSPDTKHREKKKKRTSKKSKKSSKKVIIKRKDITGTRVSKRIKEATRQKICKFFREGNCAKGADCGYSHASPYSFKKKELCKFYLSGHCNKGSDCIYMHGDFPCKFYHTGSECYAKEACRFSHAPLTDETKRILADYLKISHIDDDYDRKRRHSPTPEPQAPPPKRACLLGSPPRHIREAVETKRWQEEMFQHQHDNPAFKIHLSPSENSSPPPVQKSFYQETLQMTPPKRRQPDVMNNNFGPPMVGPPFTSSVGTYSRSSPSDNFVYEEDYQDLDDEEITIKQEPQEVPEFNWTNICSNGPAVPSIKKEIQFDHLQEDPFPGPAQQDLDFTSDIKFDETTQFSEMENSADCTIPSLSNLPNEITTVSKDTESEILHGETGYFQVVNSAYEDKSLDDSCPAQETFAIHLVVPSHLPKKQQELFKRIHQHQKKTEMAASTSDASNSPKSYDNSEPPINETDEEIKEKVEVVKTEAALWYSSDEDDEHSDEPLTDVLKKLQKQPPAKLPVKAEAKPAASIMELLSKVQKNVTEKKKSAPESQPSEFFRSLFSGDILAPHLGTTTTAESLKSASGKMTLQDPLFQKEPPTVAPKDPRLKNRDPRTLSNTNTVLNLPKTSEPNSQSVIQDTKISSSTFSTSTTVMTERTKPVPYKLHGIYTKPPNYTPYIHASQSDPNLLKDPRLRKHLKQNNVNGVEIKREADSFKPHNVAPPIPKLLLTYDKTESLNINIFEPSPVPKPAAEENQDVKIHQPKLIDPRMKRRDSQNSSGSNTPPHLTVVDNLMPLLTKNNIENEMKKEDRWTPPVLEESWIPPVLEPACNITIKQEVDSDTDDPSRLEIDEDPESSSKKMASSIENTCPILTKKATPTPASHLPRAIADPRMARLHSPLDSRRLRTSNSESGNKNVELKTNLPSYDNSVDSSKTSLSDATVTESEDAMTVKFIPKKKSSDKCDEKKKTVHRNRKSSMDYASPLNSCDDSNSNKSLSYNSYNQRPPRSLALDSSSSNNSVNSVTAESALDFLSDNSNLSCDNSSDVNLKDMFKTIDPTASPFC